MTQTRIEEQVVRLSGWPAMDEAEALKFYSADTIDRNGPCPPNDKGSSGLSGAAAVQAGSPAVTNTASPSPTPSPPGSLARYQWLWDGGTVEDCARQQDHILGAVGRVEVVIDPTLTAFFEPVREPISSYQSPGKGLPVPRPFRSDVEDCTDAPG